MLFMGRIGYLRAVKFGGRIGRIYPVEAKARGYEGEVEGERVVVSALINSGHEALKLGVFTL